MLLAVPFQGFASATMLLCAPSTGSPATHQSAAIDGARHDHGATVSKHSLAHAHHVMAADGVHSADGSAADHHAGGKCNSCAACCLGISMAPSVSPELAVQAVHSESIPFDSGYYPTVDLAFPERPPLNFLRLILG
jgi:hypothetical protein